MSIFQQEREVLNETVYALVEVSTASRVEESDLLPSGDCAYFIFWQDNTCGAAFSMTLNFVAIVLAITGILNPVIGALVHNAGSVIVIINSAFLLGWHKKLN